MFIVGGRFMIEGARIFRRPLERQEFMVQQGLRYLKHCEYADIPAFSRRQMDSPYYQENRAEFESLYSRYHDRIERGDMADVSIRFVSEDVGWGLFAEEPLEAGDFVGEYCGLVGPGEVLPAPSGEEASVGFGTDYAWDYPDAWYEGCLYEVDAFSAGNEMRYVNHGFNANLEVEHCLVNERWIIFFKAGVPIHAGTQLTVDYGEDYWAGGFRELVLL